MLTCLLSVVGHLGRALENGWMTWDFMFFSTVFQSYQADERLIMKGCVKWNALEKGGSLKLR